MAKQYAFYFNASACSGCKACQMACKDKHDLNLGILWRRVYEIAGGEWKKKENAWIPGVFAYNTSWDLLRTNFTLRFKDLAAAFEGKILSEVTLKNIQGEIYVRKLGGGHESGYAQIARILPYVFVAGILILPIFLDFRTLLGKLLFS